MTLAQDEGRPEPNTASAAPTHLQTPLSDPVDQSVSDDRDHWFAACRTISELVPMPWVMLSGGGSFEDYARQLEVAIEAGCAGFMVGRALWGEAMIAPAEQRLELLQGQVIQRMWRLRSLLA